MILFYLFTIVPLGTPSLPHKKENLDESKMLDNQGKQPANDHTRRIKWIEQADH